MYILMNLGYHGDIYRVLEMNRNAGWIDSENDYAHSNEFGLPTGMSCKGMPSIVIRCEIKSRAIGCAHLPNLSITRVIRINARSTSRISEGQTKSPLNQLIFGAIKRGANSRINFR